MATGATKSQIISGCYERFVLGHEAAPSGSDDPDAAAAFSWTQRFAVKAHQGPVKCVKVCSRPPPDSVSLSLSSGPSACDLALPDRCDPFFFFLIDHFPLSLSLSLSLYSCHHTLPNSPRAVS